jgi:F-type H+/Na+-transporting ATPase subunit alpha
VAGRLRIDLAQYEEMARFVKFGAEVDATTEKQLIRGERARELLKQEQHTPLPLAQEVLVLYAVVNGYFDEVDVGRVGEFEAEIIEWFKLRRADVLTLLGDGVGLSDETQAVLNAALDEFLSRPTATGEVLASAAASTGG